MNLIRYEQACQALAEAKAVDEVKSIRDKAEAIRAYARQAKNRQLEIDAAEIRLRAERRLGEMLREQKETVGLNPGTRGQLAGGSRVEPPGATLPTLADAGIDKKLSARAQKLAAVPEEKFEGMVAEWKERVGQENERVTTNLLREGERQIAATSQVAGMTTDDLDALPSEHFGTVYADPPWLYGNQGTRAATGNHYSGMTVDEICELPVSRLVATNAHLHLWTTNAFLFDAKRVMEAWGFTYKSCFVWVKPQMGIGNYWRVSHEFMLLGVRGSLPFSNKSLMSWAEIPRTRHSEKPEQVRDFIQSASAGPYLELFARRSVPGWTCWGNEISKEVVAA